MITLPKAKGAKKPKRPCVISTCKNLVDGKYPYCEDHLHLCKEYIRSITANNWHTKTGPTDPFYLSRRWRRTTTQYRSHHPLCEQCEREGRLTPATCTDHIIPWKQGGDKYDWNNLQALCDSCHSKKTYKENFSPQIP